MRVLKGWAQFLVAFANLEVTAKNWKAQWLDSMGKANSGPIAKDLWKDPECRDSRRVRRLQKTMREYLTTVAKCNSGTRSRRVTDPGLDDLIYDLERYSMDKGLAYFVRVLRKTGEAEADELFGLFNQNTSAVQIGRAKLVVGKFPDSSRSLEQFLYTCLAGALENGELEKVGKCRYQPCGKFFVGEISGRRHFCDDPCRFKFNNERPERKLEILRQRRRKAAKERLKS